MNICRYDIHNKVIEKKLSISRTLVSNKQNCSSIFLEKFGSLAKKLAKCRKAKQNNNSADPEASGRNAIYDVNIDRLVMVMTFFSNIPSF